LVIQKYEKLFEYMACLGSRVDPGAD
jgi:hypothetical protein